MTCGGSCSIALPQLNPGDLLAPQGDPMFLDVDERVAYNALPGTITPDMWSHQYLQQANEISAAHTDPHSWVADGPDSTVFGVEPNFGCCTANFNQVQLCRHSLLPVTLWVLGNLWSPTASMHLFGELIAGLAQARGQRNLRKRRRRCGPRRVRSCLRHLPCGD